ncbi:MAG: CPBP family intramembrane metalloprotease [Promethearchaeota archaeon]|nr:MAG: CPBP family intramembrane metalloprotease [Candidatus Lokiarchaeota archaeon]
MQLGENPWLLIGLTFLELLFVIVPALISSRLEKKSFIDIMKDMGFQKNEDLFLKILSGLSLGILFFFFGNYIIIFFRDFIIGNLFGAEFVEQAQEGAISTAPIQPTIIQLIIFVILQIIVVGPCEEAFFRGFLIKKFNTKIKLIYSIIISSICFTIYHVPPFLVPITTIITFSGYYFTFGFLLSLIFVYFNYSIIPCAVAHSCFNLLLFVL